MFAGNVYGDDELFKDPPYEFSAAFSARHFRIFRDAVRGPAGEDSSGKLTDRFKSVDFDIVRCPSIEAQLSTELPRRLNARVGLDSRILEFPVRHLNWRPGGRFQIETGPLLALDPEVAGTTEALRRAYAIFNRLDRIELLLDSPRAARRWERRVRTDCAIQLLELPG